MSKYEEVPQCRQGVLKKYNLAEESISQWSKSLWHSDCQCEESENADLWQCWQALLGKCIDIMLKTSDMTRCNHQADAFSRASHYNATGISEQILDYTLVRERFEDQNATYAFSLQIYRNSDANRQINISKDFYFEMDNIEGAEYISANDNATLKVTLLDDKSGEIILHQANHVSKFGDPFDKHLIATGSNVSEEEPLKLLVNVGDSKENTSTSICSQESSCCSQPSLSSVSVLLELKKRADYMTALYFDSFVNFCWWLHNIPPLILRWTIQGWSLFHALMVSCGFGSIKEELINELWSTPSYLLSTIIDFLKQIDPASIRQRVVRVNNVTSSVNFGVIVNRNGHEETYVLNLIPCVACRGWPTFARTEYGNLPVSICTAIHRSGYSAVPSPDGNHTWRVVFPQATRILLNLISTDSCRVACLKMVHRYVCHVDCVSNCESIRKLTFEHVLTIMLRDYEKDQTVWSKDSLGVRVLWMINELREHVTRKHLTHFFIPECNMLKCYSDDYLQQISMKLQHLLEKPQQYLP